MIKQVVLPILGVMLFIVFVGYFFQEGENDRIPDVIQEQIQNVNSKDFVSIGDNDIDVDIVDNESERKRGLSGRTSLDQNSGMLFVFEDEMRPTFWMKDMNFAIDIIWIYEGEVVGFEKNVPPPEPDTSDDDLARYNPDTLVTQVLEVNAGYVDEHGIQVGDTVTVSKE